MPEPSFLFRWWIHDARGVSRHVRHTPLSGWRLTPQWYKIAAAVAYLVFATIVCILPDSAFAAFHKDPRWIRPILLAFTFVLMLARMLTTKGIANPADRLAADSLNRGLCPSCASRLSNTPRDADGCTTCPECGSAWKTGHV